MEGERDFWTWVVAITLGVGLLFVADRLDDTRGLTPPATLDQREDPAAKGWTSPAQLRHMVRSARQAPSAPEQRAPANE
jgi:hypothetical protein